MQTGNDEPFYVEGGTYSMGAGEYGFQKMMMDVSRIWPVANEFRSASISALFCITY
jgi:hypothetical protein